MLIVILISAILLYSSVLTYRDFISKNQLTSLVNNLIGALQFARLTAMTSQTTITFCAKNTNHECGSNWQLGQLILDERNQKVLRVLSAMPATYHLYFRSTLGNSSKLQWRANGFTRGQQGSFLICADKNNHAESAQIIILRTGRIRSVMGVIPGC